MQLFDLQKEGYVHWIIPRESFRLLTPVENIATYTFNTGVAQHYFCARCGIASFYIPRSDPDKIDVNLRCLDGINLSDFTLRKFDGQNWESSIGEFHERRSGKK